MSEKTLFIVQQFERMGKRLVAGRMMEFKTAAEAQGRAERDATRTAGVVALQQTIDTDTGEVVEDRPPTGGSVSSVSPSVARTSSSSTSPCPSWTASTS